MSRPAKRLKATNSTIVADEHSQQTPPPISPSIPQPSTIVLLIGPGKRAFTLSRHLLCLSSTFFRDALINQTIFPPPPIHLPNLNALDFADYVRWLPSRILPLFPPITTASSFSPSSLSTSSRPSARAAAPAASSSLSRPLKQTLFAALIRLFNLGHEVRDARLQSACIDSVLQLSLSLSTSSSSSLPSSISLLGNIKAMKRPILPNEELLRELLPETKMRELVGELYLVFLMRKRFESGGGSGGGSGTCWVGLPGDFLVELCAGLLGERESKGDGRGKGKKERGRGKERGRLGVERFERVCEWHVHDELFPIEECEDAEGRKERGGLDDGWIGAGEGDVDLTGHSPGQSGLGDDEMFLVQRPGLLKNNPVSGARRCNRGTLSGHTSGEAGGTNGYGPHQGRPGRSLQEGLMSVYNTSNQGNEPPSQYSLNTRKPAAPNDSLPSPVENSAWQHTTPHSVPVSMQQLTKPEQHSRTSYDPVKSSYVAPFRAPQHLDPHSPAQQSAPRSHFDKDVLLEEARRRRKQLIADWYAAIKSKNHVKAARLRNTEIPRIEAQIVQLEKELVL